MSQTPKRQLSPDADGSSSIDHRPTRKRSRKHLANDPNQTGNRISATSVRVKTNTGRVSVRKTKAVIPDSRVGSTPAAPDVEPAESESLPSEPLDTTDDSMDMTGDSTVHVQDTLALGDEHSESSRSLGSNTLDMTRYIF